MSSKVEGTIVSITDSGNLVSDITPGQLQSAPTDDSVSIECGGHETLGIFTEGHSEPEMTLLAIIGKSGCLELEIVGDSAAIMLGIRVGEKVTIKW